MPLAELKRKVADFIGDRDPHHEEAEYQVYPPVMWEPYKERREEHGVQLYGALGIDRSDTPKRLGQFKRNYEFFNAPVGLFIGIDRKLGPGQWADLGGYIHALMFLARAYGLDTCAQESWARMHRPVRAFVGMPPEQMLFCAVVHRLWRPQRIRPTVSVRRAPRPRSSAGFLDSSDGMTRVSAAFPERP